MSGSNGDLLPPRVSRAQALAQRLEREIIADSRLPGERLGTKEELRQRFGVAVGTLNEAVRLMEQRGILAARPGPGGGLFVGNPSARTRLGQIVLGTEPVRATLRDCVEFRNMLEPALCLQAAQRANDADLQQLHDIIDEMAEKLADPQAYLRLNWRFHRHVSHVAGNAVLQGVYSTIVDVLDEELNDFEFGGPDESDVVVHRALADAIASKDPAVVREAVERHIEHSPLTRATR